MYTNPWVVVDQDRCPGSHRNDPWLCTHFMDLGWTQTEWLVVCDRLLIPLQHPTQSIDPGGGVPLFFHPLGHTMVLSGFLGG